MMIDVETMRQLIGKVRDVQAKLYLAELALKADDEATFDVDFREAMRIVGEIANIKASMNL